MRITDELLIDAPAERVWELTIDVEGLPSVTPTMTSVERLDGGELRVGSTARVKQPAQRPATWTVTRLEPGEVFEWETRVLGIRMVGSHRIEPVGPAQTRNHLAVELSGRGSGIFGRLVGGKIRQAIATENQSFKAAAERA